MSARAHKRQKTQTDSSDRDHGVATNSRVSLSSSSSSSQQQQLKRVSKNAPQEISSKRPVGRLRQVVTDMPVKIQRRDPRFESLSAGKFDASQFRKNYGFLDDIMKQEIGRLRDDLDNKSNARARTETETLELRRNMQGLESKLQSNQRKDFERKVIKEQEQKERELVKQGKKPFFLKKSEKRNLVLTKKFSEMKQSDVDRAIQRRRKKNASKERKQLPFSRRSD
ncbi:hypothetical protein V1514DRAFT_325360 [Lipomyces japonicus]|uniref:uncharacterized protein n=1 Tax=Lipomyces japonicus TaxID=56871 RepID=UPI0034CE7E01